MKYTHISIVVICCIAMLFASIGTAQLKLPRTSQDAKVIQTIGVTEVTIKYSRPGVKGRAIWGGLVPYDQVWRTGANEATTITFTDTVKIEGATIPAGSYMLATIPSKDSWTIIINKDADIWGAFSYKKEQDIHRFNVKPEQVSENQEWMRFSFEDLKESSAKVVLAWEKVRVSFTVETPTHELVMRSARRTIAPGPATSAANYLLERKVELDQAMRWIDLSLATQETYSNLKVKAQLLAEKGEKKEAIATMEKAIALGAKMEDPPFDFEQMKAKLADWKK